MKKIVLIAILLSGLGIEQINAKVYRMINNTPFMMNVKFDYTGKGCNGPLVTNVPPGGEAKTPDTICICTKMNAMVQTTNVAPAWTPSGWEMPEHKPVQIDVISTGKEAASKTWIVRGPYPEGAEGDPNGAMYNAQTKQWDLAKAKDSISPTHPHYIYTAGQKTNGDRTFRLW